MKTEGLHQGMTLEIGTTKQSQVVQKRVLHIMTGPGSPWSHCRGILQPDAVNHYLEKDLEDESVACMSFKRHA